MHLDRKEDCLLEKRHMEEERSKKRLEKRHQQQMKVIQDNLFTSKNNWKNKKAKEKKVKRDAEV